MKKANKKMNAAIIIIGNEILSGRTQDINVVAISSWLNELGVKLEEVRVIPDNEDTIIKTINEVRKKFKYIFTTGGIGPTHDDITSRSVAKAFNLSYGYHKEAYKILEKYYGKNKFNDGRKKMAKLPDKALLILNPSSGAPGFIVDNVYCLPGVPSILKSMLGGIIKMLKKGNQVQILCGKDKGKKGEIIEILRNEDKVKVKGINFVKKHEKTTKEKKGGIISKENFIHVSNLKSLDDDANKSKKIGNKK